MLSFLVQAVWVQSLLVIWHELGMKPSWLPVQAMQPHELHVQDDESWLLGRIARGMAGAPEQVVQCFDAIGGGCDIPGVAALTERHDSQF